MHVVSHLTSLLLLVTLGGVTSFQTLTTSKVSGYTHLSKGTTELKYHLNKEERKLKLKELYSVAGDNSDDGLSPELDSESILKYGASLVTQLSLIYGFFSLLDFGVDKTGVEIPFIANGILFFALSIKSRVFNPLANSRPNTDNLETDNAPQRIMPSWTPPGIVFPIMWVLIIGPLRAYTSAMVFDANGGSYADLSIMSLMLHLSIGDIWNTVNNVERRYGASVIGVLMVWLSAANASYQYYQVSPDAGQLLGLSLIWLTVASSLIVQTWRLNPSADNELDPLYPIVSEQSQTKLIWFEE